MVAGGERGRGRGCGREKENDVECEDGTLYGRRERGNPDTVAKQEYSVETRGYSAAMIVLGKGS